MRAAGLVTPPRAATVSHFSASIVIPRLTLARFLSFTISRTICRADATSIGAATSIRYLIGFGDGMALRQLEWKRRRSTRRREYLRPPWHSHRWTRTGQCQG